MSLFKGDIDAFMVECQVEVMARSMIPQTCSLWQPTSDDGVWVIALEWMMEWSKVCKGE